MAQTLRPYQRDAAERVIDAIDPFGEGLNRVLYTAPTSTGKTTILSEIIRLLLMMEQNHRVLVLAHRIEIIEQCANRITDHCKGVIKSWEIGTEANRWVASPRCRVIVGMVQTCCRPGRPPNEWKPTVIITDEVHHSPSKIHYQSIYERYGVMRGECIHIGTTATPKRLDKKSLFAVDIDGNTVMLEAKKGKPQIPATPETSVFERHVFDYSLLQAWAEGWAVEPRGFAVKTDTDISHVNRVAGDFVRKELEEAVDTDERTCKVITEWKKLADDKQTLVFCVDVGHAKHVAALWRGAGYNFISINGETDKDIRRKAFDDFKRGDVQGICNVDVISEGTDLPNCGCVVHMAPTSSWNRYVQRTGRGGRPLDGLLNGMEDASAEERRAKIAASAKPFFYVFDAVDICDKFELCSAPSLIDLPCNLDLEGHTVAEAKKLIDDHRDAKEIVTQSLPATFTELAGRLIVVDLLRSSNAQSKKKWRVVDGATLRYEGAPAGYTATMHQQGDRWRLIVSHGTNSRLFDKVGRFGMDHFDGNESIAMTRYLDHASEYVHKAVDEHRIVAQSNVARGTLEKLTEKQRKCLQANGHTAAEIDKMSYGYCKKLIGQYMERWNKVRA